MSTLVKTYTFLPNTTEEPSEVNQNFDEIISFLNEQVAHLDGPTFTGAVILPGVSPSVDNHAARKKYVDDTVTSSASSTAATAASATATAVSNAAVATAAARAAAPKQGGGSASGTSNGSGDITFLHGMPWTPTSVMVIPKEQGTGVGNLILNIQNVDSVGVTFRVHSAGTGALFPGAGFQFYWMVFGGYGI